MVEATPVEATIDERPVDAAMEPPPPPDPQDYVAVHINEWRSINATVAVLSRTMATFRAGLTAGSICGRRPKGWRREVVTALDALTYAVSQEIANASRA